MVTDDNPPGATVDTCPHMRPVTVDCSRCEKAVEAAQVARPPASGPRAVQLHLAKHTGYCSCNNFIIAYEDKVKRVDGEWHRADCTVGGTS